MEWIGIVMFFAVCLFLMMGYPVAITLAGVALMFAFGGSYFGVFELHLLNAVSNRIFGIMQSQLFLAVPLFVFMGVVLEKSKIAEDLLIYMSMLFGKVRGGVAISVVLVGIVLAASTGIVGATVVTMGLLSLPTMLRYKYSKSLAAGTICASGTLGQIIPPSIVLILLGDFISNAYSTAQRKLGNFSVDPVSVDDLFIGAIIPGLILSAMYILYIVVIAYLKPEAAPAIPAHEIEAAKGDKFIFKLIMAIALPLLLIIAVLGSILTGIATPTEAAAVGSVGALILSIIKHEFSFGQLREAVKSTAEVSSMVFFILIGATMFSLVFVGFEGNELVAHWLNNLPGGKWTAFFVVMLIMFLLGFILDFMEIVFIVVPVVAPILLMFGFDPIWLAIMMAINLQTSFLTPPFGFALFYLRGVAPEEIRTIDIYKGVVPFILIQISVLVLLALVPSIITWLPHLLAK